MVTLNKKESIRFLKKMLHQEQRQGLTKQEQMVLAMGKKGFDWSSWDAKLAFENEKLERWMIDNYGPRCPKFERGCIVCEKWKIFDLLKMEV